MAIPPNVIDVANAVLEQATKAFGVYLRRTRARVDRMPEHFVESFVVEHIEIPNCIRPQVRFSELNLAPTGEARRFVIGEDHSSNGRVDTVIYNELPGAPQLTPLLLIEYKRFSPNAGDRQRLVKLIQLMKVNAFGMRCVFHDAWSHDDPWLDQRRELVDSVEEGWLIKNVDYEVDVGEPYCVYCHIVGKDSDPSSDVLAQEYHK